MLALLLPARCVYELAYWCAALPSREHLCSALTRTPLLVRRRLKHKGHKGIVFVPLETNATAMRVIVRLWPIFTTLLIFMTGCFIGSGIAFSRQLSDLSQGSDQVAEELYFQFFSVFLTVASLFVIFVTSVGFYTVAYEARRQRMQVAADLKEFDVKNTEAFSPNDKTYVLGEIDKWWAEYVKGGESPRDAFNTYVQTEVASHLTILQQKREAQLTCVFALIFVPIVPVLPLLHAIGFKRLDPLVWPSMMSDVESLVTPDECYCQWLLSQTSWSLNVSQTSCVDYATSLGSGEVPDAAVSCLGMWNFNAAALTSLWFFFLLCCSLFVCCRSLRWANRVTGHPKRPHRIQTCVCASGGVLTLVVALVTFLLVWPPAGIAVCFGGILVTCIFMAAVNSVFAKGSQVAPETVRA